MMKLKFVNVFTICLITLMVLFPSLIVFGIVWEQHLHYVQNISTSSQSIKSEFSSSQLQENLAANNVFPNLYINQHDKNLNISDKSQIPDLRRWLYLSLPFCIVGTIYLYDRYLVYRAHIHQQQVEMLEKLWQQSLEK